MYVSTGHNLYRVSRLIHASKSRFREDVFWQDSGSDTKSQGSRPCSYHSGRSGRNEKVLAPGGAPGPSLRRSRAPPARPIPTRSGDGRGGSRRPRLARSSSCRPASTSSGPGAGRRSGPCPGSSTGGARSAIAVRSLQQDPDSLLDERLGLRVDRASRLVEHQDVRAVNQRPGEGEQLASDPAEKFVPRSLTSRLVALRKLFDEPVDLDRASRPPGRSLLE